ncbi:MAG: cupin domain-containing protein [Pseudomonadota bacterium]
METYQLYSVMESREPDWKDPTDQAEFWILEDFNGGNVWIGKFIGDSRWERHPVADELVHLLEGEVKVILMMDNGRVEKMLTAGDVCVMPKGIWHRQIADSWVVQYGATSGSTEHSEDESPG